MIIEVTSMTPEQFAMTREASRLALRQTANKSISWDLAQRARVARHAGEMAAAGLISVQEAADWIIRDGQSAA